MTFNNFNKPIKNKRNLFRNNVFDFLFWVCTDWKLIIIIDSSSNNSVHLFADFAVAYNWLSNR
jgi:hypothetical protein